MKNFSKLMAVVCLSAAASLTAIGGVETIKKIEIGERDNVKGYFVTATKTTGTKIKDKAYFTTDLPTGWEIKKEGWKDVAVRGVKSLRPSAKTIFALGTSLVLYRSADRLGRKLAPAIHATKSTAENIAKEIGVNSVEANARAIRIFTLAPVAVQIAPSVFDSIWNLKKNGIFKEYVVKKA